MDLEEKVAEYDDSWTDTEIAKDLNAETIERRREPSPTEIDKTIKEAAEDHSEWVAIADATEHQDEDVAEAAALVVDLCGAIADDLAADRAPISSAFDTLRSADIITQDLRDAISELCVETVSWGVDNGYGHIDWREVREVR